MSFDNSISLSELNGLTFLEIDNEKATAKVSLFGGQVLSYIPKSDGKERLWVSPHAYLNGERPILGGIPICWPWFSDQHGQQKGALPAHGFLRTQAWKVADSKNTEKGTSVTLHPNFTRGRGFEYDCNVTLQITIGDMLTVSLITENSGTIPFQFNCALHTYFHVEHIKHTMLNGIDGDYKDKLENWRVKPTPTPYNITGETDRIHQSAIECAVINVNENAFTDVNSHGNDSLVVWNPWLNAASISDMDPFGYKHMICIESSITKGKELEAGESHALTQIIVPR